MNKTLFRLAFVACFSATGCATPFNLFAKKKPQSFEEFSAQRKADEQKRVASSSSVKGGVTDVATLLNKGHAAFQQGNLVEAQTQYLAVLQTQPQNGTANHRLAVIADRHQDFNSAEHYYRAALAASPRDPNLLNDAGYSLLLQSRFAEAEQYLQTALQQNPTHANAINNMGMLFAKRGQPEQAMALFRRTSSEAEAQAKLTRLLPAVPSTSNTTGQMLATNPQGAAPNGPMNVPFANQPSGINPQNSVPAGWPPQKFAAQPPNVGNPNWQAQNAPINPAFNNPVSNNQPVLSQTPNGSGANASSSNLPASMQQLQDEMERARRQAVAERHARDLEEQTRREALLRQVRGDEFGNPAVQPTSGVQDGNNRWSSGRTGMPNVVPNAGTIPNTITPLPNPNLLPNPNPVSPLESMPAWPSNESLPSYGASRNNGDRMTIPNAQSWSQGTAQPQNPMNSSSQEDPARVAARLGMNAGPGNLFPISPNATTGTPPGYPPQFPSNQSPQNGPAFGTPNEPPSGAFDSNGGSAFGRPLPSNNAMTLPESATREALRGQVPPSEQYQTPNGFIAPTAPNGLDARPMSHSPSRSLPPRSPSYDNRFDSRPTNMVDPRAMPRERVNGNDRWGQNPGSQTNTSINSAPISQGFITVPVGESSLTEYERMVQAHNEDTNFIRQQLDAQRQLPGSENYSQGRSPQ